MNLQTLTAEAKVVLDGLTIGREQTLKALSELYKNPSDLAAIVSLLAYIGRESPPLRPVALEMATALKTWKDQPLEVRYAVVKFISDNIEECDL